MRETKVRNTVAVLAGISAAGAAGAVEAHDWKKKHHRHEPPGYVFVPPGHVRPYVAVPVVYARPVVVYPQPVAYVPAVPAYPAYYGPPGGSLSFGMTVPLR